MVSWEFQQKIRRIKEKLVALTKNKIFLLAIAFIALFITSLYVSTYTARMIELKERTEEKLSSCQENLTAYEKNATASQQLLTACTSNLTACINNATILQNNFDVCIKEKQKLAEQYKNVSFDLASCQADYSKLNKSLNELNASFEQLAKNSATNICCKRKIDEPSLKYYYIENNSIVCTAIANEKTKEFSCPSLT
jgi:uncharacterized protein (DUF3084 family)